MEYKFDYVKVANADELYQKLEEGYFFFNMSFDNSILSSLYDYVNAKPDSVIKTFLLGVCYEYELGVKKDLDLAFKYLLEASNNDSLEAKLHLANCYINGKGTPVNEKEAFKWFLETAKGGIQYSKRTVAYLYEKGIGTAKDYDNAFKWYSEAASVNDREAKFEMGNCYINGIVTKYDEQKAIYWYEQAAKLGSLKAVTLIGRIYYHSDKPDYEKAVYYFNIAAKSNDSVALNYLGTCYLHGYGVEVDYTKAFESFLAAAKLNNYDLAMFNAAACYERGTGTNKDMKQAIGIKKQLILVILKQCIHLVEFILMVKVLKKMKPKLLNIIIRLQTKETLLLKA